MTPLRTATRSTKATSRPTETNPRERGDAGLAFLLMIPALLFVMVALINASQALYERREAWAVAASASRVGAQADPFQVRLTNAPTIDVPAARAAVRLYAADNGYRLRQANFDLVNNELEVIIEKDINYIFPIPTGLPGTITGRSFTTLRVGVNVEGG